MTSTDTISIRVATGIKPGVPSVPPVVLSGPVSPAVGVVSWPGEIGGVGVVAGGVVAGGMVAGAGVDVSHRAPLVLSAPSSSLVKLLSGDHSPMELHLSPIPTT
jgi:hypothetical protein